MNSKQYEGYVADVVRSLSISKKAQIYKNRKYPGVRQPGSYEIDVACEVWIDDALFFLIIVECKNWKAPIDRPQVQKLIQTRDAISAHKAAFASPIGYTKEAIEVAKANGIALWVIAKGIFVRLAGGGYAGHSVSLAVADNLRHFCYELLEYTGDFYKNLLPEGSYYFAKRSKEVGAKSSWESELLNQISNAKASLVPLSWLSDRSFSSDPSELFFGVMIYRRIENPDPNMTALLVHTFRNLLLDTSVTNKIACRIAEYRTIFLKSGMKPKLAQKFINGIIEIATAESTYSSHDNYVSDTIGFKVDDELEHKNAELLAPISWLEENGPQFWIYPSREEFQDNIIWANVIWLLHSAGFLDENQRWNEPIS